MNYMYTLQPTCFVFCAVPFTPLEKGVRFDALRDVLQHRFSGIPPASHLALHAAS